MKLVAILQETCCGSGESEGSWAKAVVEQGMTTDLRSIQESGSTGLIGRRTEAEGASLAMCMAMLCLLQETALERETMLTLELANQWAFPGGSVVKNPLASTGDLNSIPRLGRAPGEGNGNPLQYSCLENPMNRGVWWATVHGVTKKGDTTEQLSPRAQTWIQIPTLPLPSFFTFVMFLIFSEITFSPQ